VASSGRKRILRGRSISTNQSRTKKIDQDKKKVGLGRVPANYFVGGPTADAGILGIGNLKPRPIQALEYQEITNNKNRPVFSSRTVKKYSYFFVRYDNIYTAFAIAGYLNAFVVVETLSPETPNTISYLLGRPLRNITPLTLEQYETGTFNHPKYINDDGTPLVIPYASISLLKQKTSGRLDDINIGYPNFDSTPSPVSVSKGPLPAPPIVDFKTGTGATGSVTIPVGGTVYFIDSSVSSPPTIRPTAWNWYFGATGASSASPTGSSARAQIVTFGQTGYYTVTLTASNLAGTGDKTKTNFVYVI
jgi:hypothetical protein